MLIAPSPRSPEHSRPSTQYSFRVRAYSATLNEYSQPSNVVEVLTPASPAAPSNLTATPVSDSQVELCWVDSDDNETGFTIERRTDTSTWVPIASIGANQTIYTDSGLSEGTAYYYRMRATNSVYVSPRSNMDFATTLPARPPRWL